MDAPRAIVRELGRGQSTDEMLAAVLAAASNGHEALGETLETLDAPIYVTDAEGWVTSFNSACIDFVGRTPVPGQDRWCVTWRLYTEQGDQLPHDCCPMAVAIREARPVRNVVAVAERPDGTRVMFLPHPTPIFDVDGALTGAVNLLVDVTDRRQAEALDVQAARCRRLAQSLTDTRTVETLSAMAAEYEEKARNLRN
ncbi:MAG: PAS domain S-box protein [Sphingosinicella sp.]|uniref:PAS domain S-box protein n=1 Tax=Sphingosinicella sp. TaxID=1917971 RepID=UPI004038207C